MFAVHKKCLTFAIANATGTLDEWLSQWSAKPCTAVRIRQVPQKEFLRELLFCIYNVSLNGGPVAKTVQ